MANSQNGWPVDTTGASQDRGEVAGVSFPNGVRKGDVATVLHYVARRFNAEVERLMLGSCWGWFDRPVRGASSISNHASGTAIDFNAPKHPLGAVGTFSAAQRTAIAKILRDCDGVVRWGGNYSGRKDEMHFEIIGNAAQVKALANKINNPPEDDMPSVDDLVNGIAKAANADPDKAGTLAFALRGKPWSYETGQSTPGASALGDFWSLYGKVKTLESGLAMANSTISVMNSKIDQLIAALAAK